MGRGEGRGEKKDVCENTLSLSLTFDGVFRVWLQPGQRADLGLPNQSGGEKKGIKVALAFPSHLCA